MHHGYIQAEGQNPPGDSNLTDIMTVFMHIYPIVPAPVIFLALGTIHPLGVTCPPTSLRLPGAGEGYLTTAHNSLSGHKGL